MTPGVHFAQVSDEDKEEEAKIRNTTLLQCSQNRKELPDQTERLDELKKLLKKIGY